MPRAQHVTRRNMRHIRVTTKNIHSTGSLIRLRENTLYILDFIYSIFLDVLIHIPGRESAVQAIVSLRKLASRVVVETVKPLSARLRRAIAMFFDGRSVFIVAARRRLPEDGV